MDKYKKEKVLKRVSVVLRKISILFMQDICLVQVLEETALQVSLKKEV